MSVDPDWSTNVLAQERDQLTPGDIIQRVEAYHRLTPGSLLQRSRRRSVARVRFEAMWLMRVVCKMSQPEIARTLRMRHHTTIMHGIRFVEERVEGELGYLERLDSIVYDREARRPDTMAEVIALHAAAFVETRVAA